MGNNKEITLQMVMDHMSKMKHDLETKIDGVAREVGGVGRDLREFRDEFRQFAKGVDDLDDRVQDIENAKLPERVKAVELKLAM